MNLRCAAFRVSATVLKEGKSGQYQREGYGSQPYSNFEQIMFDCQNQDFKRWDSSI